MSPNAITSGYFKYALGSPSLFYLGSTYTPVTFLVKICLHLTSPSPNVSQSALGDSGFFNGSGISNVSWYWFMHTLARSSVEWRQCS